jgi:hypothetical protein
MVSHKFFQEKHSYLKLGDKGIEGLNGLFDGSQACVLSLKTGVVGDFFDSLEEFGSGFLLFNRFGKVPDGTTGFVHVTAELVGHLEPLLLIGVSGQLSDSLLGLNKDLLLAGNVFLIVLLEERLRAGIAVDRVRRVKRLGLIRSVGSTFRVRGTISNQTENRESGRFSGGSVGDSWDQSSTGSGNSSKGLATASLLKTR